MKYLGLILVVVALMAGQVLAERIIETHSQLVHTRMERSASSKFREFLEKARIILREGNSTLGVPVMDPYKSEKQKIELDEESVKVTAETTNPEVTGLSGYKIDWAEKQGSSFSPIIRLGLTWPRVYSTGSYKLDAVLRNKIRAYGAGDYIATFTDMSFEMTAWLMVFGGLTITKMETKIFLGALELSATGIFDDESMSKILSEVISDVTPQLIEDYQKELTTFVNNEAMKIINDFLNGKSLNDIRAMLG